MSELRLILFDQSKKANVGTIVRSAVAMGVKQIVVSGATHRQKVNTLGAKGARVDIVEQASVKQASDSLKQQGFQVVGVEIGDDATPLCEFQFAPKTALIMGNEGSGLSARAAACCDRLVFIKQFSGGTASLNVACAATVVLREAALQLGFTQSSIDGSKFVDQQQQQRQQQGGSPTEEGKLAHLLVGSYTRAMGHVPNACGEGISSFDLDLSSGELTLQGVTGDLDGPSYLAFDADARVCFAVEESGGSCVALKVMAHGQPLELMRRMSTNGVDPCSVAVGENGVVACTNYSSGNVALLDMNEGETLEMIQGASSGSNVNSQRQESSHPHYCTFVGDRVFFTDLGADQVRFANGFVIHTRPGAGPRHFVINPRYPVCYVLNELDCSVCVYSMLTGEELQFVNSLPDGIDGKGAAADIHLSANGRFLYCSNRGDNSISCFGVKPGGLLGLMKGHYDCRGECPRAFALVDKFLLCCNQNSNNISVFRVWVDGSLEFVHLKECGTPVTIQQISYD